MDSWNSPLVLAVDIFPDMTPDELAKEIDLMFTRSMAIKDAISGNMPVSELCELVRSHDISIDDWSINCDDVSW
jgi:hypothetical protein